MGPFVTATSLVGLFAVFFPQIILKSSLEAVVETRTWLKSRLRRY